MSFTLSINGTPHHLDVDEDTPLIFVLRNELCLYGARLGCGLEQCGACVVLADGKPVHACTMRLGDVGDAEIETVEGLAAENGELHAIQQAFLAHNAAQCGYCLGGILMQAKALLAQNANPSREEICLALDGHLCRCGAQPRIIRAIESAAARLRLS
jgi:nicotinate dehydrogenase subunit A